jgi:hypothetical protein
MSKTTGRPPRLQLRLFGRSTHSALPIPRCFRHRFKNPFPNFGTLSGEPMNRGHPQVFDTFGGFTAEDVAFEISQRGKKRSDFTAFRSNSLKWFEYTLKQNGCRRTFCVRADVQNFEFCRPISFCLLDVDLYRPTISALRRIWPMLSPGGIIVIDDCKQGNQWDGAMQAYSEFTETEKIRPRFLLDKLGLLQKVATRAATA